jgi:alpha-L-glutamate ligase-like protein
MLKIISQLTEAGVLSMNRRNAEYIMRYNPRSAFPLVDNKVQTKSLAEKHSIPTPQTHYIIERQGDVSTLRDKLAALGRFVVKPARGAGGSGIVIITDYSDDQFVKSSGQGLSWAELAFHFSDVLSGIFSLGGTPDAAIVEALVEPDPVFAEVSYHGVPDLRIVVYRGVPVMSMVRLPTLTSDGKANLHRGAIGAGIDISVGVTLKAVRRAKVITHHPDTQKPVTGIVVPYWEQILLMSAAAMDMTGLGYLGVDLVIDRLRGPVLLELNARPGLAIQLANGAGLWNRLSQVDRAPREIFTTSERRVTWARNTFTVQISKDT